MNQDQVKDTLLLLDKDVEDFSVILSGKASKKVDGLYYPDRREIIIHNKNFTNDNQIMYTAIHEFAHHLQHTRSPVPISTRAHTTRFWDILHRLLFTAEEKGVYTNVFKNDERFKELTATIKNNYLSANGMLMKELGSLLEKACQLCQELNISFDDYVDRELLLHRTTAKLLMKINSLNIKPSLGYENMKTVAGIKDVSNRAHAEEAFIEGKSPDMVKAEYAGHDRSENPLQALFEERDRIERSIDTLTKKLVKVERKINEMKFEDNRRMKK